MAASILRKANVNLDGLKRRVQQELERLPRVSGGSGESISSRLNRLLMQAEDEAKQLKDEYVSVEHLLLRSDRRYRHGRPASQGVRRHAAIG